MHSIRSVKPLRKFNRFNTNKGFALIITILTICAAAVSAGAQTFAPDSGIQSTTPEENGKKINAFGNSEADFIPNENPNKTYDNSIGKVVKFKFVDGKVVFSDNEDRKILVYMEDYKVEHGIDNMVRCSMRIYVLNDMKERLNNLSIRLKWPEISTTLQMVRVNPGVRTYTDAALLGNGCFSMDKTPVIEVNRCRINGKTEEQCADAVQWFKK